MGALHGVRPVGDKIYARLDLVNIRIKGLCWTCNDVVLSAEDAVSRSIYDGRRRSRVERA